MRADLGEDTATCILKRSEETLMDETADLLARMEARGMSFEYDLVMRGGGGTSPEGHDLPGKVTGVVVRLVGGAVEALLDGTSRIECRDGEIVFVQAVGHESAGR